MLIIRRTTIVLTLALGAGCNGPSMSGGFDSPNPASNMQATLDAVRSNDRQAIVHIVELLDSDDPGVRLLAINALQRMTETTMGYEFDAPRYERNEAIQKWVDAIESGDLADRPAAGSQARAGGIR